MTALVQFGIFSFLFLSGFGLAAFGISFVVKAEKESDARRRAGFFTYYRPPPTYKGNESLEDQLRRKRGEAA